MMTLLNHVLCYGSNRHVQPIIEVLIDRKVVIALGVFSNRFNFEKLLQHLSQGDIANSVHAFAGSGIFALCYIAEHDASLFLCRI